MLTNQLNEIISGLGHLGFELALAIGALLSLILGIVRKQVVFSKAVYLVVLLVSVWLTSPVDAEVELFGGMLILDQMGNVLKVLFSGVGLWIIFFPTSDNHPPEFYFLILTTILGSVLMLSANHLLVIYLVVELTSFGAYLITNFNFRKQSFEAGMKYLIFGGTSSALALYGASLIYGFTGTLALGEINFDMLNQPALMNVGVVLFIGALLFKVSVVPFHIWVPSTYQEAPTDAVFVLSVIPKIAGFVLLHRILWMVNIHEATWFYLLLVGVGIATVVMGTFGALQQTNLKRLIAYGAIAHSGFLLAALLVPSAQGATAFLWYAVIYALMNLAVFYWIAVFEGQGKNEIQDFAGLSNTESYMGGLMVIIVVALIGLPPTAGFTAKFYLFTAMWEFFQTGNDVAVLTFLIIMVLSVVISLFIYLKIPFQIFLRDKSEPTHKKSTIVQRVLATILTVALLWIFFSPEILNKIAVNLSSIDW